MLCGILLVASLLAASTMHVRAQAPTAIQTVPQAVIDGITKAGLHTPTNFRQRGPNFTANALTRTGAAVKVVIQSSNGAIIGYRVIMPVEPRP
jgi:pyruvate/2-oxoglutarate dehydrogenase complex dihydrolipoamide dehydrogenase (E3) component